ncbi:MAG: ABC-2 family transporter protein [Leptospiraceae bacterium]|nr:ABC-2 family transporter protein [Leptospiraceae bacterium]MCP5510753.1 ABC-2 family transporter protein [Leptospiraceae bacterium]
MGTYLKFVSKSFQRSIAYKLEYYTGLANAFLYILIFTSVWKTVADESPGSLGTWTGDRLVEYAILSTLIKVSFGRNEYILTTKIKSGDIAYDLLKPFRLVGMYVADSIGVSLFQTLARALPLLLFSLIFFGIVPNISILSFLKFLPIYLFAFGIFIAFGFLISSLAFFLTEVFSFMVLYSALVTLLSGSVIPVNLLPEFAQNFISWTPFPYLYYFPTAVLIGNPIQFSYPELIARYIIEFSSIAILSYSVYRVGVRKMEFAGG